MSNEATALGDPIETPPNVLGFLNDAWFKYAVDLGNAGPDKGKGAAGCMPRTWTTTVTWMSCPRPSNDNKVAWYENLDGNGTFGSEQIITTIADGAFSVYAADLDQDGDMDVLSASFRDDKLAWYENLDGVGTFGAQQVISTTTDSPVSVFAADVDGDGDPDVLSASKLDDTVAWYENRGGQFAFATTDTAPAEITEGGRSDLLRIETSHRGRAGDHDEDLASLTLLFEESPGDAMTSSEANSLIDVLSVYRDTGNGTANSTRRIHWWRR